MATINVKKTSTKDETSKCKCDKNVDEITEKYREDLKKLYEDVPVYTDNNGNIHVNKEYAKEFPEITKTLVDAEIKRSRVSLSRNTSDGWYIYPSRASYTTSSDNTKNMDKESYMDSIYNIVKRYLY